MARILVVDDDPEVHDRLAQLGDDALSFTCVANANEMMSRLDREAWDLMLVDINLLIFRGDRLVKTLTARGNKRPPILYFSAEDDARLANLAQETGVEGWVSKSGRNADILAAIRRHLPA